MYLVIFLRIFQTLWGGHFDYTCLLEDERRCHVARAEKLVESVGV